MRNLYAITTLAFALTTLCAAPVQAQQGETVKIGMMLPLSGPFAAQGQNYLKSWQFIAQKYSGAANPAGVKFEIVSFDNKGSPQETLNALKAAADQGLRYVTQQNGSGAALALSDAVTKFNDRNPGREILNISSDAQDPSLTNDKCSFWYFRLDPDTGMKMEALTSFMKEQPKIKRVYVINQDYAHGHQVSKGFKDAIGRNRPDVVIVGDELHPLGQVKDFAPYAAKIKQSGADTIVTGSWGQDLTLLVKALNDAGVKLPMYTYYANVTGTPTAIAGSGDAEVFVITYAHPNLPGELAGLTKEFKDKFNDDYYHVASLNGMKLLSGAIAKAKSTDPVKVAQAMEGLSADSFAGVVTMRKSDHQLQQSMFVTKWQKAKPGEYSVENTGFTFVPIKQIDLAVSTTPTTCQMKRPAGAS